MFGDWNFLLLPHNFVTSLWLDYWRLSFCPNYMYFRNLNTTGKSCLMYLQHYKWYSLNQMPLQLFFINMYHCSSMFCICLQRNVAGRCRACSLGIINLSKNPSTLWPRAWCTTMFYRFSSVNECKYMYDQSMLVLYSILLSMLVSSVVSSLVLSHVGDPRSEKKENMPWELQS